MDLPISHKEKIQVVNYYCTHYNVIWSHLLNKILPNISIWISSERNDCLNLSSEISFAVVTNRTSNSIEFQFYHVLLNLFRRLPSGELMSHSYSRIGLSDLCFVPFLQKAASLSCGLAHFEAQKQSRSCYSSLHIQSYYFLQDLQITPKAKITLCDIKVAKTGNKSKKDKGRWGVIFHRHENSLRSSSNKLTYLDPSRRQFSCAHSVTLQCNKIMREASFMHTHSWETERITFLPSSY